MVLATKSKNIKDSKALKIITIALSIVLCVLFVKESLPALEYYNVFGDAAFYRTEPTLIDSNEFKMELQTCASTISDVANHDARVIEDKETEDMAVEKVLKCFKESQTYYNSGLFVDKEDDSETAEEYYDEDDQIVTTTMVAPTINKCSDNIVVYDDGDNVEFAYNLRIFGDDVYLNFDINLTEEQAEAYIRDRIREAGNEVEDNYNPSYLNGLENVTYYAVAADGTEVTNAENIKSFVKNIESADAFYYYTNPNNAKCGNFFKHKDYEYSFYFDDLQKVYLQFDTSFSGDDNFKKCYEIYNIVEDVSFKDQCCKAAACLGSLLLLLVIMSILSGHKNGEKSLAKIDKLPNDLHFVISIGMCIGAGILVCDGVGEYIYEKTDRNAAFMSWTMSNEVWFVPALYAGVSATYLLFAEWLTSICRYAKTHSKYFENTIVIKTTKLIHGFNKKNIKKIIDVLSYSTINYKRNLVIVLVGYGAVSLALFVSILFLFACEAFAFGWLMVLLFLAMQVVCWIFTIKYIINLDKIITASCNRVVPDVDYYRLPNSLKTLVDSLMNNSAELQKAVQKAVRDEHLRTELITNVSHDLKTPLTSIINYVDLLKQCDIDDENAMEYISVLDEKSGKLKRLIEDLIEASKATSGIISVNKVKLNLNELVTEAIVEHQQDFMDNNLDLIFKGDKKNVTAFADGNKTYRIIENLLSNARKYSAKNTRVYADVYSENGKAVFEIKNVSAEPLDITPDELTERFVRGDKSRNMDGNGLGLSIADSFCRAMEGSLELTIDGDLFKAKVVLPE